MTTCMAAMQFTQYINKTFRTSGEPEGTSITDITPMLASHLRSHDDAYMNIPFSGGCEGVMITVRLKMTKIPPMKTFI